MARLFISAARKSSGKTTVSVGIVAALRARGLVVQPFKKGPDYIDPMWLTAAAGRSCRNLDFHTMGREEIRAEFVQRGEGADFALIEGNKGLHDGVSVDGSDSNAALAKLLAAPVVLVVDTRGITRGIAPLLNGYSDFDAGVRIAGVILNQVAGARHEGKLAHAVDAYTDIPVLGRSDGCPTSHSTRRISASSRRPRSRRQTTAWRESRDVSRRTSISTGCTRSPPGSRRSTPSRRLRPARARCLQAPACVSPSRATRRSASTTRVIWKRWRRPARDSCRSIPIEDSAPPAADGIFIGGGFPERAMVALEANSSMRASLRERIDAGTPVYAECGGLMYLARRIRWGARDCEMVGAIPADVVMHARPRGRGYVVLEPTGDAPWAPAAKGPVPAHEFHHSSLENLDGSLRRYAYRVRRGRGLDGERDGIVIGSLLASYSHLRDVEGCRWAERFVAYVRERAGTARSK